MDETHYQVVKTDNPRLVKLADNSGAIPIFSIVGFLVDYDLPPVKLLVLKYNCIIIDYVSIYVGNETCTELGSMPRLPA